MKDIELFNDSFQNYKVYGIPKAQLILTDVPYVLGNKAYASNPSWYVDGDNRNGESDKAGKHFVRQRVPASGVYALLLEDAHQRAEAERKVALYGHVL